MSTPSSTSAGTIVSLDIGSSSARALLFDRDARPMEGYSAQVAYQIQTTAGSGAELDPEKLAEITIDCLDEAHRLAHGSGFQVVPRREYAGAWRALAQTRGEMYGNLFERNA